MTPPKEPWVAFGGLLGLFKTWITRPILSFASVAASAPYGSERTPDGEVADSSDLLKRRMRALHLDPDDLDRAPARVAGVTTGLCARCEARGKCARDLDDEFGDPGWGDWRNYCPNATTLSLLSTLHECEEEQNHMGHAIQQAV
jgi:hypothetical protein